MLADLLEASTVDYITLLGRRCSFNILPYHILPYYTTAHRYTTADRRTGDILQWMAAPDYQASLLAQGSPLDSQHGTLLFWALLELVSL